MSNPGKVKKRLFVILTKERMKGHITKRDWDLFKQVIETGVKTLFSVKSDKLEEIRELLRTAPVPPEEIPDEIMKILGPSIDSDSKRKPECFSEMTEDTDENGCDDCPYSEDCMEATSDIYEESLESDTLRTNKK